MRPLAIVACLGITAAALAAPPPRFNDADDLAEIARIERLVQPTVRMAPIIGHYADDAVTADLWAPGVYRGRDNLVAGFDAWLAPVAAMEMTTPELTIASDGDLACSLMQLDFRTTLKTGKIIRMSVRTLDAFRKIDGRWRIVQQHVALPLDPATGRALTHAAAITGSPAFPLASMTADRAIDEASARRELAAWTKRATTETDARRIAGLYGPDATSIAFGPLYPGVARGGAAVAKLIAADNLSNRGAVSPQVQVETETNGRFAVQLSTRQVMYRRGDGTARPVILRQSDCLRRTGGRWRSFFEQRSYLVAQTSGEPEAAPIGALDRAGTVPVWNGAEQKRRQ